MSSLPSQDALPLDFGGSLARDLLRQAAVPEHPGEARAWDELRTPEGELREPWQRFAETLPAVDPPEGLGAELDRRAALVEQQIRLDGVTHNVFSDGGASSRPWSLELLPLIITTSEWAGIEAGAIQRAALLEAMLEDLYGPQRLLHDGLLPPALVLRHPGYLRAMRGVAPACGQRLHIVAFDLARGPDGQWWFVAQRCQGPSGLGYVLHNRITISRQFPDAFRELHVQHIASSYRRLLDTVDDAARQVAGGATPRVVLLTPGPFSETYFEHAYLARYLGVPLVEGGDLTVRGERLFLKTVEGLEPVHGIVRRLDDDWCDPLELRPDSSLGVPGLLQVARAGTVVMANALGSAFLESPAIKGFLPGISERLLGEPLAMPSLPTWWCGEGAAWADVREHLADKMVRSTYPRGGRSPATRDPVVSLIEQDPDAWTVQGRLRFSRTPIWSAGAVHPRPAMVRVYAIADGMGRWHVLPGGMTRVAQRDDASVSMQRGGTSLDTWVLTEGPVDTFSMLPKKLAVDDIAERRRPVASRTGENLYWLGRYTERTEQLVRLARATLMLIDADADADEATLAALSSLAATTGLAPWGVPTLVQAPHLFERAVLDALADVRGGRSSSVAYNLSRLASASAALRERLSSEQWGLIRTMGESFALALEAPPGQLPALPQVLPALDRLTVQLAAVTGMQTDRMTRDHGWRLLAVGRLIERLIGLAQRLEVFETTGALASPAGTDVLLDLFDSTITFRARYQRREDLLAIIDLLVLDTNNPRAFGGVLRRLRTELSKLPGTREQIDALQALLPREGAGLALESLRGLDDAAVSARLLALARHLAASAMQLSDRIGERYFTLAHGLVQAV
ncbi:MAG: circularly permuted type 2 ATP-grasp protein [Rubrivivax sp.]|nr:circularly permuted type 2 ATP-grasp protein [Rubrivivax sp.]